MKDKDILTKLVNLIKYILITLICILIVLIIGVSKMYSTSDSVIDSTNSDSSESEYNSEYDVSMFKEIKASDIQNETKKEKRVLYIGRETCGWCAAFLPMLWQAQDEFGYKTLYIDIAKIIDFSTGQILDQKAYDTLSSLTGKGYENYMEENLGATPMILILEKGKIIGEQAGYSEYETFKSVLETAGIK